MKVERVRVVNTVAEGGFTMKYIKCHNTMDMETGEFK